MHEGLTYSCNECGKINCIEKECDCNLKHLFHIILYKFFNVCLR